MRLKVRLAGPFSTVGIDDVLHDCGENNVK